MPLPNNALVLVADGTKILFLRNHGDENQIDLRTEAHDQREDRKDREIKTDAPGYDEAERRLRPLDLRRDRLPAAGRGPLDQGCGGELKARVLRNDFDALAIVAPPKALGVLKNASTRKWRSGSSAR